MGCLQNHKCIQQEGFYIITHTQAHTQNWGIGAKHVNKDDFLKSPLNLINLSCTFFLMSQTAV